MYVTLEEAKKQLQIDQSYSGDNTYIEFLIGVAEDAVERTIKTELSSFNGEGITFPPSLKHAILLYVADLYANRESIAYTNVSKVPFTFEYLLAPFINYDN